MKTGNTRSRQTARRPKPRASMEPGHEDREYDRRLVPHLTSPEASMEPGHEDREYIHPGCDCTVQPMPQWSPVMKTGNTPLAAGGPDTLQKPQWSPVMKTGNTRPRPPGRPDARTASMEPGHEDREYGATRVWSSRSWAPQWSPVMKTGNTRKSAQHPRQ